MRIGIIGTGAMACLFAARLHRFASVVLIGTWQAQIDTINKQGLLVDELDGRQLTHFITATQNPAAVAPVDVALVLTKSYQTIEAVERVNAVLAVDGIVITLQNGLGNLEHLAEAFGRNRCTLGITTLGATIQQPGRVRHAGEGVTHLAIPPTFPAIAKQFAALLQASMRSINVVANADALLWSKVALNAGINPLTALYNVPNGRLATDPVLRRMMVAAAEEVEAVANALNVTPTYQSVSKEIVHIAMATSTNRSSMLQDVTRGAPTEIDAICGEVVHFGRKVNIPTHINALLWQAIIDLESGIKRAVIIQQLQTRLNSLQ
ncbi:MAG: ketopantoate reductase family protein [Candidatus Promineifilaceae bacterium]